MFSVVQESKHLRTEEVMMNFDEAPTGRGNTVKRLTAFGSFQPKCQLPCRFCECCFDHEGKGETCVHLSLAGGCTHD